MGGMKWMRRTIKAGQVREKYRFLVPVQARPRGRRVGHCSPRAQDANEHTAEKRVARLLNCNFVHRDAMLGLEYDEMHHTALLEEAGGDLMRARELALRDVDRFIERVRYHARKAGLRLNRYFCVVSNMDGDTGEYVRDHAHLIVKAGLVRMENGRLYVGEKDLEALWGMGAINLTQLHNQPDLTPLALYLLRQVQRIPDKAKYKAARGMEQPEIIDEEIDSGNRSLRVPKGAKVSAMHVDQDGSQYVRYVVPAKSAKEVRRE